MRKFKWVEIAAAATGLTLKNALSGLGERARTIRSIRYARGDYATPGTPFQESTGTRIRVNRNQEEIVDFPLTSFQWGVFSNTVYVEDAPPILVDIPMKVGDGMEIGFYNATVIPYGNLVLEYEEPD